MKKRTVAQKSEKAKLQNLADKCTKPNRHKNKSKITAQTNRRKFNIFIILQLTDFIKHPSIYYFANLLIVINQLQIFYLLHR